MSTPNESEFNKQIKQKLQGLPVDDGAAIWSELEQRLDKKDSKKILFWWNPKTQLLLLFGLFIGGISAFYFYQNSSTPILANNQEKTITTQKPIESVSPEAPSTVIETKQVTTNTRTTSQDITINTATIAETKAEQQDKKNIIPERKSAATPTVSPKKEKNQKPNLSNATTGATASTTTTSTPASEPNTNTQKQDPPTTKPSDNTTSSNPLVEKVLAQAQPMPTPSKDSTQSAVPTPAPTPDAPAPDTKKTQRLPYVVLEAGMGFNSFSFDNFRRQNNPLSPCFSVHADIPYGKYFSSAIQVNYIDSPVQNRYNVNALHFLQLGLNNRWHITYKLSMSAGIGYARFLRIYTLSNQIGYLPMSENRDSIPRSSWRRESDVSAFVAHGDWNINYGIDYRFKNYGIAFRGITGLTDITINTPSKYRLSNFSLNLTYWIPLKKR